MEDKTLASIANKFAADLYGAKVYAESIEDHFGNQTSFALIARTACRKYFLRWTVRPPSCFPCNKISKARF